MKIRYLIFSLFILSCLGMITNATEADLLSPPPLPEDAAAPEENISPPEEFPEPDITIIQRGAERFDEYRIGGHLYMIKVTPHSGPAYYLIDSDGDGNLDVRRDSVEPHYVLRCSDVDISRFLIVSLFSK